jgi:radical SAM-linked protein
MYVQEKPSFCVSSQTFMNNEKVVKYHTVFSKTGAMVYISHLDLMTLFRRSMRRADLPYVLTKGFTPRVRISMPKALKLGISGESEEMTLWLREDLPGDTIKDAINSELPEGVRLSEVRKL